jgi:uncharacterized protein (DUF1684 family)
VSTTELYNEADLIAWRESVEAELRAPEGWLSVAGLYWLRPGVNRMGSDPAADIVLPTDAAPPFAAEVVLEGDAVRFGAIDAPVLVNGAPPPARPLRPSTSRTPDRITLGRLALQLHASAGRLGIRVRDPEHPARRDFAGRQWYAPQPAYCVPARFTPYEPPRPTTIATHDGEQTTMNLVGTAHFTLHGQELSLDAFGRADGMLFFVFRDATSGTSTYGAARFLYADPPHEDWITLDFNRAVSPPCAFTEFATCPLPPPQNRLAVAIEAGERE